MNEKDKVAVLKIVSITAVLLFIGAFLVKWLWNWLMPDIFSLSIITYWQAMGLSFLSTLLFYRGK